MGCRIFFYSSLQHSVSVLGNVRSGALCPAASSRSPHQTDSLAARIHVADSGGNNEAGECAHARALLMVDKNRKKHLKAQYLLRLVVWSRASHSRACSPRSGEQGVGLRGVQLALRCRCGSSVDADVTGCRCGVVVPRWVMTSGVR